MQNNSFKWFTDARFGMFIHWGLYALPGGRWKGETMDYIGEWLQSRFRIPNQEYAPLAKEFNPVHFDAEEWVRTAREAGMRYLVYTAKHHDGFAMYHSKVSSYNITDATPFGRDPLRELADACKKYDMHLGIYYSQALDWSEADAADPGDSVSSNFGMSWGNDWDFPDREKKCFHRYFTRKVLPQIRELFTRYAPISLVWFDCAMIMTPEETAELVKTVKTLAPDCLINSRIGYGLGDYGSLGDNQHPNGVSDIPLESPSTLNGTWGFKWDDHNWKTPETVAAELIANISSNSNYLLNIGPMPDGRFPPEAVQVLRKVGHWIHHYAADAVYGAAPNPFSQKLGWGWCTRSKDYLNFFLRPGSKKLRLCGLSRQNPVQDFTIEQKPDEILPMIRIPFSGSIPELPMPQNRILCLYPAAGEIRHGSDPDKERDKDNEESCLNAAAEKIQTAAHSTLSITGRLSNWHNPADSILWQIFFPVPGNYRIRLETQSIRHSMPWIGGREVEIVCQDQILHCSLNGDEDLHGGCYPSFASDAGLLTIREAGVRTLSLRTTALADPEARFMDLVSLDLLEQ